MEHYVCSHCYQILKAIFHPGEQLIKRRCSGQAYCCRCGNLIVTPVLYHHENKDRFQCEGIHPYLPYVKWPAQDRDRYQSEVRRR